MINQCLVAIRLANCPGAKAAHSMRGRSQGQSHRTPNAERLGQQVNGEQAQPSPMSGVSTCAGDARCRRAADARVQNDEGRTHGHRKKGEHTREIGSDRAARCCDGQHAESHHARPPRKIGAGEFDAFHCACDAKTAGSQNRDRINNCVQYDCACCAPVHQPQQEHGAKPNRNAPPRLSRKECRCASAA